MADGEISIERNLEQIKQGISDIGTAARAIDKDLKAVNAGLRLDPTNTELLAQKQALLSDKLENSKNRSQELSDAINELNRLKSENGQLTDGQNKLLSTYEQQLRNTNIEVTALTGATQKHAEANEAAESSTISFSKSMTEFQSNLRAVKSVVGSVDSAFRLLGGDSNSAMGKLISQSSQVVSMMSGIASMSKLLEKSNSTLAKSFSTVAFAAGAAVAAYSLGTSIINLFGEENRKTVGAVMTVIGVLTALTFVALAAANAMTWGAATIPIMAAIGAGIAGVSAMLSDVGVDSAGGSVSPDISVPSAAASGANNSVSTVTNGDTLVTINIYDADKKSTSAIVDEINKSFTSKKLAYR